MFSMINRGKLDQPVQEEFEHLFARLRGFLSQSFDEDGELIVADPNFAIVPIGGIVPFAGQTAPVGYLMCDGRQVSRVTYQSLYDTIGVSYGSGDGSTTFNVPDLRERFPKGGTSLGAVGGAINASHAHTFSAPAPLIDLEITSPPPHTHTFSGSGAVSGTGSGSTDTQGYHSHTVNDHAHSIPSHAHDFSGGGTTGSEREGLGPLAVTGINGIAAAFSPHTHDYSFGGTTNAGGNGTTGGTQPGTTGAGDHAHSVTTTLSGSTSISGSTSAVDTTVTGSATASAISGTTDPATVPTVPPFVTVQYLIYAGVFDEAALRRERQRRL